MLELHSFHVWFCENGMAHNPTKSDMPLPSALHSSQRLKTMSGGLTPVKLDDLIIQFSDTVKILGATLDSSLTLRQHPSLLSNTLLWANPFIYGI